MIKPVIGRPPEVIEQGVEFLKSNPAGHFGPWFMAVVGTTLMLGVLVTQTVRYFSTFGYESLRMFALVVSCFTLSILQWIVLILATWDWFVVNYGDWSRFALVPWEIPALEVLTRLTVFVAQIFFAQRCYALYNRSRVVFTGVMIGMSASLVLFAMVSAVEAIDPYHVEFLQKLMIPALSISLLTDLSITGLTVWKLGRRGGHTLSPNTDDVIQRLRNVTLEAAAPPAIAAFLNLALCFRWTDYTYHWFGLMTPKLYVWSLMFTLNSRVAIREKFNSPNQGDDDRAGKLSTGFEFAKSSRLNRKPRGADRGHDRTTFILSDLSRPPQLSGITVEEATEMDEDLRSKDVGDFISDASTNRQRLDSDCSKPPPNFESRLDGLGIAPRRARRNSEPALTSSQVFFGTEG